MRRQVIVAAIVGLGIGLTSAQAVRAHHAFASEFDATKPIKIQGTIVKVDWTNPHSWFHLDVRKPDGTVERWMIEGGGPGPLTRRGFTKDAVRPGTEITVEGFLAKGAPRRANGRVMRYADGREMFMGSTGTGAPVDGRDPTER